VLHQASVCRAAYSPKQDQVRIIFVGNDFKIIAGLNLEARPDRFGQDNLTSFTHGGRHLV